MFGCSHICKLYQKTVTNKGDLNGTTRFLWGSSAGSEQAAGWQCLEERDSGGDLVAGYTYATGYIDAVAVQERDLNGDDDFADDHEVVYYHSNTLYSVYALSDADENVVERMRYDAYGAATVLDSDFSSDADGASDVENPYTFTGRRLDAASDLMQYRNRCYEPALGRFVSRDPVLSQNLYQMVGGRPGTAIDPYGLQQSIYDEHYEELADQMRDEENQAWQDLQDPNAAGPCTEVVTTRIEHGEWDGKWKKTWPLPWNKREKDITDWWFISATATARTSHGIGGTYMLVCDGYWAKWVEVQKKWKRKRKRTVTTIVTTKKYCCGKLVSTSVEKSQETEKDTEYEWRRVDAKINYKHIIEEVGPYYSPKPPAEDCAKYGLHPPED